MNLMLPVTQKVERKIDETWNIRSMPQIFENFGRIEVRRNPNDATEKRDHSGKKVVLSFFRL